MIMPKKMTSIYSKGLGYIENEINTERNINRLKSKIKLISTGGITTGNFLKGIKERYNNIKFRIIFNFII